ncbi:MAG: AMP-binding protein [Bacteroidota bacterium]
MPHDPTIRLAGEYIPLSAIATLNPSGLAPAHRVVVAFVQQWLNGAAAFTIHTSGSTGKPKAVRITRKQMEASAQATAQALQLKPGMTALLCLDPALIAGKMMVVRTLVMGMNLIVSEPVANPLEAMGNERIHFAAMVPYQVVSVLKSASPTSINRIEKLIVGGAPLPANLENELQQYHTQVYATYGMTETLSHVALRRVNGPDRSHHFTALAGVRLQTDERGCLVIEAPYLNVPIITNDLVTLTGEDQFEWLGRADHVINSGGVKIIPEMLEEKIRPVVEDVVGKRRYFIYGYPHASWGQQVTLVVEGTLAKEEEERLVSAMKHNLTRFEVPKGVVCLPAFAEVGNGKINREASAAKASPPPLSN